MNEHGDIYAIEYLRPREREHNRSIMVQQPFIAELKALGTYADMLRSYGVPLFAGRVDSRRVAMRLTGPAQDVVRYDWHAGEVAG